MANLFAGVHPEWARFLKDNNLDAAAADILAQVTSGPNKIISPPPDLVFEFLRYAGPRDTNVVILGQDPYPTDAAGLCFSVPNGVKLKGSLKTIFANLEANRLARPRYSTQDDQSSKRLACGELHSWAMQGVLLMNAALTTRVGGRGNHRGEWKAFTEKFIASLSRWGVDNGKRQIYMLWGGDARKLKKHIASHSDTPGTKHHHVFEWTHPSPLSNNQKSPESRFERAPHFVDANRLFASWKLPGICWDPLEYVHAFTDGGCVGNGTRGAVASFAAAVFTGPLAGTVVKGLVPPREFRLVDDGAPEKGFAEAGGVTPATNNRGEYLAWCWVLLLLLRSRPRGRVEVVSDCNLFIKTMEDWLPARRRKGTERQLKNYDLVHIAGALLDALRSVATSVTLTHVNSHQKAPGRDDPRAYFLWYGNAKVDAIASEVIKNKSPALDIATRARWPLVDRWTAK